MKFSAEKIRTSKYLAVDKECKPINDKQLNLDQVFEEMKKMESPRLALTACPNVLPIFPTVEGNLFAPLYTMRDDIITFYPGSTKYVPIEKFKERLSRPPKHLTVPPPRPPVPRPPVPPAPWPSVPKEKTMEQVLDEIKRAFDENTSGDWTFVTRGVTLNINYQEKVFIVNGSKIFCSEDALEMVRYIRVPENDDMFFDFFNKLGKKLGYTQLFIHDNMLMDTVGDCSVSNVIFALAGENNFYERFGFENIENKKLIEGMKNVSAMQMVGAQNHPKMKSLGLQDLNLHETCKRMLDECRKGLNTYNDIMQKITSSVTSNLLMWGLKTNPIFVRRIESSGGRRSRKMTRAKRTRRTLQIRGKRRTLLR